MPPKKGKIIIKKEDKNIKGKNIIKKEDKNIKDKKSKIDELSLKSTDDDSIDEDDYESLDLLDLNEEITQSEIESEKETELELAADAGEEEEEVEEEVEKEVEAEADIEETESEAGDDTQDQDDECMYKKVKVKNLDKDDDNDNEELEEIYDDDNLKFDEIVKSEERITKPFMTIFERVRLLGDRAKQLSLGAKPMIKGLDTMNPKEIAKMELEKGVLPLIIERVLPNGRKERWRVNELQIIN
jgi:DNA-directed RNA polymerase subunit K/omega